MLGAFPTPLVSPPLGFKSCVLGKAEAGRALPTALTAQEITACKPGGCLLRAISRWGSAPSLAEQVLPRHPHQEPVTRSPSRPLRALPAPEKNPSTRNLRETLWPLSKEKAVKGTTICFTSEKRCLTLSCRRG